MKIDVPNSKTPKASVIVVTWNGLDWMKGCLESLAKQTYREADVIVVDNASEDGTVEWIREHAPNARLIAHDENALFAGGNNIGANLAMQSGSEYLLLLNNDAEAAPNWIEKMIEGFEKNADYGILGSTLYDLGTHDLQDTGGSLEPTGKTTTHKEALTEPLQERDWTTGAAFGIRTKVYEELQGLDESYGMYFEDVDFCVRAAQKGWKTGVLRDAKAWHKKSGTSSPRKELWSIAARIRFVQKHGTPAQARALRRKHFKRAFRNLFEGESDLARTLQQTRKPAPFESVLIR